jgi:hypothetical protein
LSLPRALLFGFGFGNVPILLGNVFTGGGYGLWGALRGRVRFVDRSGWGGCVLGNFNPRPGLQS